MPYFKLNPLTDKLEEVPLPARGEATTMSRGPVHFGEPIPVARRGEPTFTVTADEKLRLLSLQVDDLKAREEQQRMAGMTDAEKKLEAACRAIMKERNVTYDEARSIVAREMPTLISEAAGAKKEDEREALDEAIDKEVRKVMARDGIDYCQAFDKVGKSSPALFARRYRQGG